MPTQPLVAARIPSRSATSPPLERCVLLGLGGTPDAKRPLAGRSWLRPPTLAEVEAHAGNLGCRTGDVRGTPTSLWVLDLDAKAGGLHALAALEAEYGPIPGGRVRTGGGGLHIYMEGAPGVRSRKLAALDTGHEVELKANVNYVVYPGSVHENGRRYVPESPGGLDALAKAPDWLRELASAAGRGADLGPSVGDRELRLRGGFYDIPTTEYVEVLTGSAVDRRRKALCPLHEDHEPTLQAYKDGHWFCSACQVGGRIRQLAAITLGVGYQVGNRWEIGSHERPAVEELLRRTFPEVEL
jgi:Bifunctional DNA primase/polymerase, N-terminal